MLRAFIFLRFKKKGEEIMPWLRMGDTLITHPLMSVARVYIFEI
nr:MAG TPA: hypothetical protein [Caudoviricetes sp.]